MSDKGHVGRHVPGRERVQVPQGRVVTLGSKRAETKAAEADAVTGALLGIARSSTVAAGWLPPDDPERATLLGAAERAVGRANEVAASKARWVAVLIDSESLTDEQRITVAPARAVLLKALPAGDPARAKIEAWLADVGRLLAARSVEDEAAMLSAVEAVAEGIPDDLLPAVVPTPTLEGAAP